MKYKNSGNNDFYLNCIRKMYNENDNKKSLKTKTNINKDINLKNKFNNKIDTIKNNDGKYMLEKLFREKSTNYVLDNKFNTETDKIENLDKNISTLNINAQESVNKNLKTNKNISYREAYRNVKFAKIHKKEIVKVDTNEDISLKIDNILSKCKMLLYKIQYKRDVKKGNNLTMI